MRHHRRQGRHRRGQRRALRARGRDGGRRRPRRRTPPATSRWRATSPTRTRCATLYARVRAQYGHVDVLFNNAGISPNDDASVLDTTLRGVAARAGRQPQVGLPVLQVRHRPPARERARRVGHQHRLVRGGHGRRDLADLLHRQQGRRAGDVARAGRRVRPPRRARQRALPGPGRHAAAARAVRQGPREGRAAARPRPDRAASPAPRRSPPARCSWPATSRPSSRPRRSWSTAASAAPTSPPSKPSYRGASVLLNRRSAGWRILDRMPIPKSLLAGGVAATLAVGGGAVIAHEFIDNPSSDGGLPGDGLRPGRSPPTSTRVRSTTRPRTPSPTSSPTLPRARRPARASSSPRTA